MLDTSVSGPGFAQAWAVAGCRRDISRGRTFRRALLYLRVCANTDTFEAVLDYLPVSAELDRERYAAVGRALADPKRLCVLESLAIGELSVSDLSTRVGCQVPNMSQHLAVLRRAGLVTSRRDGNTILYRLTDDRVLEAYRLIQDIAR
jgi:DNA-binding transcriptional ArsR family regulator